MKLLQKVQEELESRLNQLGLKIIPRLPSAVTKWIQQTSIGNNKLVIVLEIIEDDGIFYGAAVHTEDKVPFLLSSLTGKDKDKLAGAMLYGVLNSRYMLGQRSIAFHFTDPKYNEWLDRFSSPDCTETFRLCRQKLLARDTVIKSPWWVADTLRRGYQKRC